MRKKKSNLTFVGVGFERVGKAFLGTTVGKLFSLFSMAIFSLFDSNRNLRTDFRNVMLQVFFTGVEVFPVLFVIATLFGAVSIVESFSMMGKMGFGSAVGSVLAVVIVRELGPIFTAFLIAGRSGSALTTMIGGMQVNSEIDALSTMGVNPIRYLVMPSLFGGSIAVFMMNMWFSVCAIGGGFLISKAFISVVAQSMNVQLTWDFLFTSILQAISFSDFVLLLLKPLVFGCIIVINACYQGFQVNRDIRNLPKATSRSVIYSFLYIVIADSFFVMFNAVEYMGELSKLI